MSVREHRDELLVLVVLVLVTALGLGTVALVQRRGGDGASTATTPSASASTANPVEDPTSTPSTRDSDGATPSATASSSAAPDGVQVRGAAYLYACRLLQRADVIDVFGPFSTEGFARQQYLDRTPTGAELRAAARLAYGGITSSCIYVLGDAPGHTVEVVLTQFPTTSLLQKRWTALRRGSTADRVRPGRPVSKTDGRMLSLADRRSFVIRGADFLVEVRYSSANDALRNKPMTPREVRAQLPQMRQVYDLVTEHAGDGSATEAPQATDEGLGPGMGRTRYVEPCTLFTSEALQALGGATASSVVVNTSYRRDDQFTDAPVATCERTGTRAGRSTFAVLEVRLARDEKSAQQVEAKHLSARYPRRTRIVHVSTDAGQAYLVDVGGSKGLPWRRRAIHLVVGPYEILLTAVRDVGRGQDAGREVTDEQLGAAVKAIAAELPSAR